MADLEIGCCFCDDATDDATRATILVTYKDTEQAWWCHLDCFIKAIHPTYQQFNPDWNVPTLQERKYD